MPNLKKYVLVLLALAILISFGLFWLYSTREARFPVEKSVPHFYKDSSRDISKIKLKIFYAIPKNKSGNISPDWQELIIPVAEDAIKFHAVQFKDLSQLNYDIFPQPFILENDSIFYDTDNTDKGNPEGLRNITPELERRASEFIKTGENEFLVIGIIYEGVGASGTDGAMILSKTFLYDPQYNLFRSSLFYHEFGHTLGLPDEYDIEHNTPYSNDIMGAGRRKSINSMYISRDLLINMGVIQ